MNADLGTGPIALALAARLGGSCVVVSDLCRIVDVNKDPFNLDKGVRQHAIRYQNALFANRPRLLIEVHGHVSGHYDVEISTGFELDRSFQADAIFLEKLTQLRRSLPEALGNHLGKHLTLGVWPLDRDVEKIATNTFTFQKLRRARRMAGLEWYGLHIELNASLRGENGSKLGQSKGSSTQMVETLSDALGEAIRATFEPLPSRDAAISLRRDPSTTPYRVMEGKIFTVSHIPDEPSTKNLILLNPDSLHTLSALEGDPLIVRRGEEELHSQIAVSRFIQPGYAGLTQRMCQQIHTGVGQKVSLARLVKRPSAPGTGAAPVPDLVVHQIQPGKTSQLWLSDSDHKQLVPRPDVPVSVVGRTSTPVTLTNGVETNFSLPLRGAALSSGLADQLAITLGEILRLTQG